MCARFTQQLTARELHDLYSLSVPLPAQNPTPRYNGAPTQDFQVCRLDAAGRRSLAALRWGLVPCWAADSRRASRLINARAETVHQIPSYRAAFRSRRCLIPANGWFEWRSTGSGKQPYFLAASGGSPLSFAALWERWEQDGAGLETFTIITTAAAPELQDLHPRQPAIVGPDRFADWLDPGAPRPRLLEIVRDPVAGPYERRAVSRKANSVRNDTPDILLPVSAEQPGSGVVFAPARGPRMSPGATPVP